MLWSLQVPTPAKQPLHFDELLLAPTIMISWAKHHIYVHIHTYICKCLGIFGRIRLCVYVHRYIYIYIHNIYIYLLCTTIYYIYIFICIVVPFLNIYRFLFLRYGITKAAFHRLYQQLNAEELGVPVATLSPGVGGPCENGISSYYWDLTNKNRDLTNLNKSYLDSNGISLGCSWFSPELMCFLVVLGDCIYYCWWIYED